MFLSTTSCQLSSPFLSIRNRWKSACAACAKVNPPLTDEISRDRPMFKFPLVQTKIVDFFRIQRCSMASEGESRLKQQRKKRTGPRIVAKRKRKLLPFNPSEDPARRMAQMASLGTALTATGAEFSDELIYAPGMAPRSTNRAALEREGMQTLNLCKRMMGRGECPPLMVVFDAQEGWVHVETDRSIRDLTIITEYAGDVDFLKNREDDDWDSIMTLMTAMDPAETLVICPDKRGNIARFINGINNHTPGRRSRISNASRDIRRGEGLYYDYNGYEQEYPTQHFL
ncbi:unnamed protein product [Spirodela intermedia]|uniref:SET domain-containing protein n=2 Tax=Spirodela intermedia TaxID=51605 RepID=A0A7I8LMP2_SPIIN|nr:unnamed protein product [Spirodela intermedia]CAA6673645.1 unnamed protein product [Spirodela intermedia]CAA7410886.1 unnamed protein product [Spirodela intermedia]